MTKRAHKKHARRPRDLYETPPEAVRPLLPFLEPGTLFVEPCCGSGHLVRAMEAEGHFCVAASDIAPLDPDYGTLDALALEAPPKGVKIITNPPWDRKLLHPMIVHFSDLAPTWLLFDADWKHNLAAAPLMDRCRRIVSVGRVKWIFDGSRNTGFDNVAWYEFGRPAPGVAPLFYPRGVGPAESRKAHRRCAICGDMIDRFGRWRLIEVNGLAAPAHVDCHDPRLTQHDPAAPTPLLEWGGLAAE